jgi:hypothetical protein
VTYLPAAKAGQAKGDINFRSLDAIKVTVPLQPHD